MERAFAALEVAPQADTAEMTLEDLPLHIRAKILGSDNLPDLVDLARVRAVSRAMREAADDTGREISEICTCCAAKQGCLSTLKNQLRRGCLDEAEVCEAAVKGGHLKILMWAREHTLCSWSEITFAHAAAGGHLEVLKWLRQNGCPWDEMTCVEAAEEGHLEVLKWARENSCPWDERTCLYAAQNGHLEVLKWARQNGCPWDKWTCAIALENGHFEVLKWARENGCPWTKKTHRRAARMGYVES